jgi:hypothetical protein
LRPIDTAAVEWLVREAGPRFVGNGKGQSGGNTGRDNSRSAIAFRKGAALRRQGCSFEEMSAALRSDPETAEWVREKGEANGGRELRRIWEKAGEADPVIADLNATYAMVLTGGRTAILKESVSEEGRAE